MKMSCASKTKLADKVIQSCRQFLPRVSNHETQNVTYLLTVNGRVFYKPNDVVKGL